MKRGDFVEIDFVGRIASTGEIFDLTDEEVAKSSGIYEPKRKYKPVLVIIGAGMVIPGVEKELMKMKPGEEREFTVKPEDAFGLRRIDLIKVISLSNFLKNNIKPVPGDVVEIDGRRARVQSVSGGRVRVDFNHPLAGKELKYKLRIVREIKTPEEKVKALMDYYKIKCETKLEGDKVIIKPEKPLHKIMSDVVKNTIKKWIKEIKSVEFKNQTSKEKIDTAKKENFPKT